MIQKGIYHISVVNSFTLKKEILIFSIIFWSNVSTSYLLSVNVKRTQEDGDSILCPSQTSLDLEVTYGVL